MVDVKLRLFIPSRALILELLGVDDTGFGGDNRNFSYSDGTSRAEIWLTADNSLAPAVPITVRHRAFGQTARYSKEKIVDVFGKPFWWKDVRRNLLGIEEAPNAIATAEVTNDSLSVSGTIEPGPFGLGSNVRVDFHVNAFNPLEPVAPAINCDLKLLISTSAVNQFTYSLTGAHDGFPAYELYLQQRLVYEYDPVRAGASPLALFGEAGVVTVNVPLTIFV